MENKTISMLDEIQEAKPTDVLLVEGEHETNRITKENLFKGLVKDEDFESKTEGLVKEDQLTETLRNYVTTEQLGDSLGKLDQLDSIGSLKSTKFDYAEVYTDSSTKETVIDFYAGSNPDGTAIKNEEGIYPEDRDKGEKVHSVRFIAGNVEIEPGTLTSTYPEESTIKTKDIVVIPYVFRTQNRGDAIIYASIVCGEKSKELEFPTNKIGAGSLNLGQLDKGINFITIYAIDAMGQMTNELNFKIICGALEISSTFDDDLDYNNYSKILIPVTVDALDDSEMTLTVRIDDNTYTQIVTYGYNEFIFPEEMKTTAVHKVWMQVTTTEFASNELTFDVIVISSSAILVSSKNTNVSFEEGVSFKLDYRISCDGLTLFKSKIYVNGTMVASNDAIPIGTNYFNCSYEDYPKGEYDIRIVINSMDDMMQGELTIHVSITQSSFARIDFVRSGLEALFQMNKNTNDSITKEYLLSSVPNSSGQYNRMDLHGYNYNTNGWIDGKLVSNGTAYAEIDLTPFADNCTTGFTFDISYSSSNMGDDENIVCQCIDPNTKYGIKIDSAQYNIKTENNELSGYYTNDTDTRITFVIHRTSTYVDNWIMNDSGVLEINPNPERKPNPMIQVYIDGILSDVAMLSDSGSGINKVYESIVNNEKILINTDKTKTLFGVNAIKTIAIYNRPLDHEEVLQNLIADIDSLAGQKEKYDKNYVTINSDIPTLYFEDSDIGKWSETTKSNKQYLKVTYSSPDPVRFGPSFESLAQTSWQGTSSLAYPVKNIKIKLYKPAKDEDGNDIKPKDKLKIDLFGARDGDGFPENVFTIKVD